MYHFIQLTVSLFCLMYTSASALSSTALILKSGHHKCVWKDDGTTFKDPNNQYIYYKCHKGLMVYQICPNDTIFNEVTNMCEPNNCNRRTTEEEFICIKKSDFTMLKSPDNQCNTYIICWLGKPHYGNCAPGLSFNSMTSKCDTHKNYRCEREQICPATGVHKIKNAKNCQSYYLCVGGVLFEQNCADGLNFSNEKKE